MGGMGLHATGIYVTQGVQCGFTARNEWTFFASALSVAAATVGDCPQFRRMEMDEHQDAPAMSWWLRMAFDALKSAGRWAQVGHPPQSMSVVWIWNAPWRKSSK